jgi:hypothetical protein
MVFCKKQSDDFIKKYFALYYCLQVGIVVAIACVVVFTIGFQSLRYNLQPSGSLRKNVRKVSKIIIVIQK